MASDILTIQEYQDWICGKKGLKCPPRQKYDPDIPTMNQLAPLWAIAFETHQVVDRLDELLDRQFPERKG